MAYRVTSLPNQHSYANKSLAFFATPCQGIYNKVNREITDIDKSKSFTIIENNIAYI